MVFELEPLLIQSRAAWADEWQPVLQAEPIAAQIGSNGQIGTFQFRIRHGVIKYAGQSGAPTNQPKSQVNRQWIRALSYPYADTDIVFQGRAELDTRRVMGPVAGIQTFTALSGEQTLARIQISTSRYTINGTDERGTSQVLPFNQHPTSRQRSDNRSAAELDGSYVFQSADGNRWTVEQAIKYLLAKYVNTSTDRPEFTLTGSIAGDLEPTELPPVTDALQMLKALVAKQAGHSFVILPTATGYTIRVFSLAVTEVTFGAVTVPANPDVVTINTATDPNIELTLEESTTNQYDRIKVLGEHVVVCRSFTAEQLKQDWDTNLEATYIAADNDQARTDPKFANLWCRWVIDLDETIWTGDLNPFLMPDGQLDPLKIAPLPAFTGTLESLPLQHGVDYAVEDPVVDFAGDFMPPQVFVEDVAGQDGYRELTQLNANIDLTVLPDEIGFQFRTDLPHVFAGDQTIANTEVQPLYDFATMFVTLAFESTQRLRREHGPDEGEQLIIEVPNAEYWLLAKDTGFTSKDDGSITQRTGAPIALRDDGDKLDRVMAGAITRYLSPRGKANGRARGLFLWHQSIGAVVTTDDPDIQSVLTSVSWSFENGFTTSFKTGFSI